MSKAVKIVSGIALAVVGVITMQPQLVAAGVSLSLSGLAKTPKTGTAPTNTASTQRLNKTLVPEEYRKIVFGKTASGLDMRYWEVWGSGFNNYDEVLATATHKIQSYQELYLEGELVPFSGNNATGTYAGALTRRTSLVGVAGTSLSAGAGSLWTANCSLTGCSHMVLAWTYSQSKLPNGIPSRITQVIEGALVYDPRRDSTRGGSGSHRAEDQTTWEYSPTDANGQPLGRNNALQALWYLIGWRLNGRLVAGRGVELNDINFASFITAANNCVSAQYYSDMILSTGDSHSTNEAIITAAAGGQLEDPGGLWSYYVAVDDTASIAVTLTDDDILEEVSWVPQLAISEQFNEVAGTFVDASSTGLYQPRAYPTVTDAAYVTEDGFRRRRTINYQAVQSAAQAQKLARIELNRARFQGVFRATFNMRAFRAQSYDCVLITFSRYGWVNKLFRVSQVGINPMGGIDLVMREEHSSVYSGGTVATVPPPSAGQAFDPRTKFAVVSLLGVTRSSAGGVSGTAYDGVLLTWAQASQNVRRIEIQFKKSSETYWTPAGSLLNDKTELLISPLLPGTSYNFQVRFISLYDMIGDWYQYNVTTSTTTSTPAGAVTYSDGSTIQSLQPAEAGANVTGTHTAAGITGQSVWATYSAMSPGQIVRPGSNVLFDGGFKLRAQGWTQTWAWANPAEGPYFITFSSSTQTVSSTFPVLASQPHTLQFEAIGTGYSVGNEPYAYIAWYNSGGGTISNSAIVVFPAAGAGWVKRILTVTAPAGAVTGRVSAQTQTISGGYAAVRQVKVELGSVASVFSDDATSGALYANGVNIDTLKPGELGANVTETRTASAITGQGALATMNVVGPGNMSGFSNLAQIVANMGPITAGSININNRFAVDSSGNVTIVSATSGARMTLSNSVLEVYDASNVRRVRLGIW